MYPFDCTIEQGDCLDWLRGNLQAGQVFDLIYCDPLVCKVLRHSGVFSGFFKKLLKKRFKNLTSRKV